MNEKEAKTAVLRANAAWLRTHLVGDTIILSDVDIFQAIANGLDGIAAAYEADAFKPEIETVTTETTETTTTVESAGDERLFLVAAALEGMLASGLALDRLSAHDRPVTTAALAVSYADAILDLLAANPRTPPCK